MKYLFFVTTLLLLQTACSNNKEVTIEKETENSNSITLTSQQIKAGNISTGTITQQLMNESLQLNGEIDVPPQNIVSVSFPLGGYLKKTSLLPGMHVSKGESIAIIEDQALIQLQQDYLMAKTKLTLTHLEYDRQKTLNETKASADKLLQQAQAEYESQRILVKALDEKLRLAGINPVQLNEATISRKVSITSPINGFVSKVNVNIGKYVQPQDILFELIDPTDFHAALTVFEKDINKLNAGQKVNISFVDEPEKKYNAEIILVTKNVDENRSGLVHCHFINMPSNLKPGMFITAQVELSNTTTNVLPEEAIVRFENKEYVFVENSSNQFIATPITTGTRSNGWVQVKTDAALLNKKVVTKNAFTVLSMLKNTAEEE
ncbi:MAG: efflux RND transporter periplasmic adaptor subunit [Sphingobacteriales bacterium]|nr:MAG: efflux RND transporter periplasmic adaptor subunit [Sphingobacteriales bacterium]